MAVVPPTPTSRAKPATARNEPAKEAAALPVPPVPTGCPHPAAKNRCPKNNKHQRSKHRHPEPQDVHRFGPPPGTSLPKTVSHQLVALTSLPLLPLISRKRPSLHHKTPAHRPKHAQPSRVLLCVCVCAGGLLFRGVVWLSFFACVVCVLGFRAGVSCSLSAVGRALSTWWGGVSLRGRAAVGAWGRLWPRGGLRLFRRCVGRCAGGDRAPPFRRLVGALLLQQQQ